LVNGEGEVPDRHSTFKDVLESEEKKEFIEPFLDTTIDDEEEFLSSIQEPERGIDIRHIRIASSNV